MTRLTERQLDWLIRQTEGKAVPRESVGQLAARWGVSLRWLRKLRQRWRQTGSARPQRRGRPPGPQLTELEQRQIEEEHQRTPRGPTKLWRALAKRGISISHQKVYLFAQSRGWAVPNPRKQRPRGHCRYERAHSGSLLHGDWHRTTDDHPHCILWEDDASRLILSGGEFPTATTAHAIATLQRALRFAHRWNLDVREVNTDQGSQFFTVARSDKRGVPGKRYPQQSVFGRFLIAEGIRHVVSRRNHPQTNGKLERLWLEYDRHRWRFTTLGEFIEWHNDQIHDGLWLEQYETPREAFQRKLPPEVLLGLHLRQVHVLQEAS